MVCWVLKVCLNQKEQQSPKHLKIEDPFDLPSKQKIYNQLNLAFIQKNAKNHPRIIYMLVQLKFSTFFPQHFGFQK